MTDLEINIALATAMGWVELSFFEWIKTSKTGFIFDENIVLCSYEGYGLSKEFDYRDPVIFVAICKHWNVSAISAINKLFNCYCPPTYKDFRAETLEKAAALCVIDAAKRGVK